MVTRPFFAVLLAGLLAAQLNAQPPARDLNDWEAALIRARQARADEGPKLPDVVTFDKLVVDTLRDVHNRGADLFNNGKEFAGAYRMYQGALVTVKPLLAHRPAAQKLIDSGLSNADKETSDAMKAFKLHEAIEAVRANLKEPIKKPTEVAPLPRDKKAEEKKPEENKKPVEKKPEEKKPVTPVGTKATGASGVVTLRGQPLTAAEVTLVTLDEPKPRVFTAPIQADGSYSFKEPLPAGRYVVIVTAKTVPEKYSTSTTSGLVIVVKPGGNYNIELN